MELFLTRDEITRLYGDGLDAVKVWVRKPVLIYSLTATEATELFRRKQMDMFGIDINLRGAKETEHRFLSPFGHWKMEGFGSSMTHHATPFGKMFGYADTDCEFDRAIATRVWNEITDVEFKDVPFTEWWKLKDSVSKQGWDKWMLKLTINNNGWSIEDISEDSHKIHIGGSKLDEPF